MSEAEELFPCSGCSKLKASDKFKIKNGTRARTCLECQSRTRGAKKANKENLAPSADLEEEQEPGSDLDVLPLEEFLDALTRQDDNLQLEARVDICSISGTRKEKSDAVAALIWARMKYRFTYATILYAIPCVNHFDEGTTAVTLTGG